MVWSCLGNSKRRRRCALPAQSKSLTRPGDGVFSTEPFANTPVFCSAAGSEAPRRFGWRGRVAHMEETVRWNTSRHEYPLPVQRGGGQGEVVFGQCLPGPPSPTPSSRGEGAERNGGFMESPHGFDAVHWDHELGLA